MARIAGGVQHTALNGEVYRYGTGRYLVASVDLPVVGSIVAADEHEPFMAVVLRLRPDRIAALLPDTGPTTGPSGERFAVGHAPAPLLDALARLLALLDQPADVAALAPGIEREILWPLLTGPQAATIRQIGVADRRLARAIRWIRDHYEQPMRIDDIAAIAAMSPSSFHRHFRALTSMTPLQYQKQYASTKPTYVCSPATTRSPPWASRSANPAPRSSVANTVACPVALPAGSP